MNLGNPLGQLGAWVTDVVESLGYAGIAVLLLLETIFPPLPSEGVLPLAGFLSGRGRLWFPGVVLAATAGSMAGALLLYAASRMLGAERVRGLVRRYGRFVLLREADLDRALGWFERHGRAAVFLGRLVPMVRSLVSVPAGLEHMPVGQFALYTFAGSALWNSALVGLGWAVGDRWQVVQRYVQVFGYVTLAALVAALVRFIVRRRANDAQEGA